MSLFYSPFPYQNNLFCFRESDFSHGNLSPFPYQNNLFWFRESDFYHAAWYPICMSVIILYAYNLHRRKGKNLEMMKANNLPSSLYNQMVFTYVFRNWVNNGIPAFTLTDSAERMVDYSSNL